MYFSLVSVCREEIGGFQEGDYICSDVFRESSLVAMQRERDQIDRGFQTVTHRPNLAHHLFWYGRVLRMAFIFIRGIEGRRLFYNM